MEGINIQKTGEQRKNMKLFSELIGRYPTEEEEYFLKTDFPKQSFFDDFKEGDEWDGRKNNNEDISLH